MAGKTGCQYALHGTQSRVRFLKQGKLLTAIPASITNLREMGRARSARIRAVFT